MLTDNKLLVDINCPLCKIYTKGFIKMNLLDESCVYPYQFISDQECKSIDMNKAKTEIALHDSSSGETRYGLASLLHILTHNNVHLNSLANHKLLTAPLSILYKFITYNRKVVYPYRSGVNPLRTCLPSLHVGYRWAFIIFVALFTAVVVNEFTSHLFSALGWMHNYYTELLVCFGQVAWQGTVAFAIVKDKALDYLGNMSTVSFIGALILMPFLLLANIYAFSTLVLLIYFAMVIGIMFLEHNRRCKTLGITTWMTFSWVAFRFTALGLILLSKGL